jgi:hypothetical protein
VIDAKIIEAARPVGREHLAAYNIDGDALEAFAGRVAEAIVAGIMDDGLEEAPLLDVVASTFAIAFTSGVEAGRLEMGGGA